MAKIYGLFGAMSGKTADVVMAVRNGEQLVRKYQPVVSNPNTPAQIAVRAKLKMLSQLSAVMAPVIAIPRVGNVSARNRFTKENYPLATYASDEANITLANIQLTKSAVAMLPIGVQRLENSITASLAGTPAQVGALDVDRVVYCMFTKTDDNRLRFVASSTANSAGVGFWDVTDLPLVNTEVVVLAYGVRDNTERARVTFGNLEAVTAQTIARLVTSRTLLESDITLTETRGATLGATPNP